MRSYSYFSSEAWRWSTIARRHSFGGKTKTLVFLRVSIKEEQRRVKSWRFELRNDPSLAAPLLYQHCTLSVASSVFSWMSGGGGNTVGCLVPASLPLACHGARAGFGCGLVVDVHDNKKTTWQLTAARRVSAVLLWLTFPGLQNALGPWRLTANVRFFILKNPSLMEEWGSQHRFLSSHAGKNNSRVELRAVNTSIWNLSTSVFTRYWSPALCSYL